MTAFDVNHTGYDEINAELLQGARQVGEIISRLNTQLAAIPEAIWGGPQPIWLENQQIWNKEYEDMVNKINTTVKSSTTVHEIFREGDLNGTRIMMQ